MKIVILSDTHHNLALMKEICPVIEKEADLIVHAGDNFRDTIFLHENTGKPVIAVTGNCDFEKIEEEVDFDVEGVKFFLTHGHRYGVKYGYDNLVEEALERGADIAIFGHTHKKTDLMISNVRIINPGSLSQPRDGKYGSYVMMEVEDGKYKYEFRFIE